MKQGRGAILGNAGEHYVLAELLRHDIIAGLTPRNTVGLDILATIGSRSLSIRVKTKSSEAQSWVWSAKRKPADAPIFAGLEPGSPDDLVALVDIPDEGSPVIHLVRTDGLDELLKRRHREWLSLPGRGGRAHRPSKMRRLKVGPDLEALHAQHGVTWESLRG